MLASLGAVGYAAGLVGVSESSPVAAQYPPSKVTICHHTHSQSNPFVTITVSENAVPAHLGHGDTIGACPSVAATPAVKAATPSVGKQKPQHFVRQHKAKKAKKAKQAQPATGHDRSSKTSTAELGSVEVRSTGQARAGGQARTDAKERGQGKGRAYGHAKEHGSADNQSPGQEAKPDHGQGNGAGNGGGSGHGNGNGKDH